MSKIQGQMMKIRLEAFDHRLLDKAVGDIVSTVHSAGVIMKGPIPLPVQKKVYTINRSTHVNKASRQKFMLNTHNRMLMVESKPQAVDSLMRLNLPSGVNVKIEVLDNNKNKKR